MCEIRNKIKRHGKKCGIFSRIDSRKAKPHGSTVCVRTSTQTLFAFFFPHFDNSQWRLTKDVNPFFLAPSIAAPAISSSQLFVFAPMFVCSCEECCWVFAWTWIGDGALTGRQDSQLGTRPSLSAFSSFPDFVRSWCVYCVSAVLRALSTRMSCGM